MEHTNLPTLVVPPHILQQCDLYLVPVSNKEGINYIFNEPHGQNKLANIRLDKQTSTGYLLNDVTLSTTYTFHLRSKEFHIDLGIWMCHQSGLSGRSMDRLIKNHTALCGFYSYDKTSFCMTYVTVFSHTWILCNMQMDSEALNADYWEYQFSKILNSLHSLIAIII